MNDAFSAAPSGAREVLSTAQVATILVQMTHGVNWKDSADGNISRFTERLNAALSVFAAERVKAAQGTNSGARDALQDWWEGVMKCPHTETVTGLAMDCLPCLREILTRAIQQAVDAETVRIESILAVEDIEHDPDDLYTGRAHRIAAIRAKTLPPQPAEGSKQK